MSSSAPARAPRPPSDAAYRHRALDPAASFIVQAPAGSGKTSLLVQRFLVLLSRAAQPESVVAITFTRKAAAEMRARIIAALERAGSGEAAAANAYDQVTLDAARLALDRDREHGWDLRSNPARLRIQTIDSLCASIVQRMPWMARTGGMPRIVEDARELYRAAAIRTLSRVAGEDRVARAAETLLLHLDNNFRNVQELLELLLPKRDQWLRHLGVQTAGPELRDALEAALAAVVARGLERASSRIPPLVLSRLVALADSSARRCDPPRELIGPPPAPVPADLAAWRLLAGFLLTGSGSWRKSVDARLGFPPHYKEDKQELLGILGGFSADDELLAALQELRKLPDPAFTGPQWSLVEALLTLLPIAAAELKVAFREAGAVDFVELGEAARRALGSAAHPSDLAFSLGDRIEHLLIDEFQDTSVSQFELTERLVAAWEAADTESAGDRTLFLVGDPMQSIYRFREAEVGLFLRARRQGVGEVACEPLRLTANFRSRPGIVEWVNAAFAGIFPAAEDPALGAVPYSPSEPSRTPSAGESVTVHPFASPDEAAEAGTVARLAAAGLATGSAAILVRARSHAASIVAALTRDRIPFRAVEFDLLNARPAVQDLVALTRALLHLGDRASWLATLRAPWCGLTLAELHSLAAPDPKALLWDRFSAGTPTLGPIALAVRDALAAALARIRRVPLREAVEACWQALAGPRLCATAPERDDCHRYFELLDEIDSGGEVAFDLLERRVEQLFGLPAQAEGPAVDIMTIHKAKGLEWDTVILPGLGREAAGDPKPLLRWSELPGDEGARLVFAPIEATREERDPIFAYLAHVERQRARLENARLLYVAATRAREQLHLLGHADPNPRAGTLLHLLWPAVSQHFAALATQPAPPAGPPPPLPQTLRLRASLDDAAPLPAPGPAPAAVPDEQFAISFEWAGDARRHAGTVTHRWLERIGREGLDAWTPDRVRAGGAAIRSALEALGLAGDDAVHAAASVEEALLSTLADPRGRWLLSAGRERAGEFRVSLAEPPLTIRHFSIDLTFVDESGARWIVDFKTGVHQGGNLDAFLDNERERYRAQMEQYARYFRLTESRPIRLGLYFPLVGGGWREWQSE